MFRFKRILKIVVIGSLLLGVLFFLLSLRVQPENIQYGMSFNTQYATELELDWLETYDAIIDDLGVRRLRLSAQWSMVEPIKDKYNWVELDYQLAKAELAGAEVILAVGRRLPRWPECHVPDWAQTMTWAEQQQEILNYMQAVVERYKDRDVIKYWQVENEPYLEVFAKEYCGEFDKKFFKAQVEFMRSLDNSRPLLVTDSGNLGLWAGPYRSGDAFGTSVYVYFWNPELGQFRSVLPPWFYRVKANIMALLFGSKETMLIELAAEPWLIEPVINVDIDTQYKRMDPKKFEEILIYAKKTRFEKQYLWGAEWWYWLKINGRSEMWEKGKMLFSE